MTFLKKLKLPWKMSMTDEFIPSNAEPFDCATL